MRKPAPELFEAQPDLLFRLVTMLNAERLVEEGIRVYVVDQRPNQFVITIPQAYHAGFNHGLESHWQPVWQQFNMNEAVNLVLGDWEV